MKMAFKPLPPIAYPLAWGALGFALLLNLVFFFSVVRGSQQGVGKLLSDLASRPRQPAAPPQTPPGDQRQDPGTALVQHFMVELPDRSGLARQVGELEALLRRNGLAADAVTFSPEKSPSPAMVKYTANLNAVGTYAAARSFLADLQNSPQLFCIQSLSLKRQSERNKWVGLQVGLAIYLRPTKSNGTATSRSDPHERIKGAA
jgi:hypothetical protein